MSTNKPETIALAEAIRARLPAGWTCSYVCEGWTTGNGYDELTIRNFTGAIRHVVQESDILKNVEFFGVDEYASMLVYQARRDR